VHLYVFAEANAVSRRTWPMCAKRLMTCSSTCNPSSWGRGLGGYGGVDQPNQDDPATLVVLDNCLASAVTGLRKFLNFGAVNETRTRDPDLGKTRSP